MFDTNTTAAKEKTMNTFRFAPLPTESAVGGAVTLLVSAWFLVAVGAMLTDSHSDALVRAAENHRVAQQIAPDARLTIVVEARRSDAAL